MSDEKTIVQELLEGLAHRFAEQIAAAREEGIRLGLAQATGVLELPGEPGEFSFDDPLRAHFATEAHFRLACSLLRQALGRSITPTEPATPEEGEGESEGGES